MNSGFKFPILDSAGNPTSTVVDFNDMFVKKTYFNNVGLFAWGANEYGTLGQNNTIHRSSPIQVGALTNWQSIQACTGTSSAFAINVSGAL